MSSDSQQTQHAPETDEATLRQMTGAPDLRQPLVSQDTFADVEIGSERPIWKLPFPKLALIATALVPVFGAAGFFFVGNRGTQQQSTIASTPSETNELSPTEEGETTALQEAEQEISTLKSQMALDDQAYVKQTPRTAPATAIGEQPKSPPPVPQAMPASTRSVSPSVRQTPPPPPIQASPSVVNRATPVAQPLATDSLVEIDPFEQWRQLAQLGSYGGVLTTENSSDQDLMVGRTFDGLGNEPLATGAVPTAYFSSTSAIPPTYTSAVFRADSATNTSLEDTQKVNPEKPPTMEVPDRAVTDESDDVEIPSILVEEESRILGEQTFPEPVYTQSLIAGGHAAGQLATPVVFDNEGVEDRFLVVLAEPLMDNTGQVAIPESSLLVVQVDRTSEDGLVQMSATQAIWEEDGFQRELVLPSHTLLIRGDGGNPLIAESYGDRGGAIASMDTGQFFLGAIQRVGELYTRSDSRVQTGDGTTVITESNPAPNILAGALEGGSAAILDSISERNQRAIERLEQQPRTPYLPAGSDIQVFINQSMQMPSGL
ncbi:MAG: hypothetical protein AAFV90_24560 [Cyanobacteria bacterium J06634_5]